MQISINDTPIICPAGYTLLQVLENQDIPLVNIAVAVNEEVIPKIQWNTTFLQDGSHIIIIKAVQGG